MRTRIIIIMLVAAAALSACTQKPPAKEAVIDDRVYMVTLDQVKVTAGIVSGEVTELKIMERIERGSGRIDAPARLTGKLVLKNTSAEHSVRLLGGKIHYLGGEGQAIKLEGRAEPTIRFSAFGSDRLEPGQQVTHAVDVDFPAAALMSNTLKEIQLELMIQSSWVTQETARFAVSLDSR